MGPRSSLVTLENLRTILAKCIVQHFHRPRPLVVAAWFWLGVETDDLDEERDCTWAVLDLDLDNAGALLALAQLRLGKPDD